MDNIIIMVNTPANDRHTNAIVSSIVNSFLRILSVKLRRDRIEENITTNRENCQVIGCLSGGAEGELPGVGVVELRPQWLGRGTQRWCGEEFLQAQ